MEEIPLQLFSSGLAIGSALAVYLFFYRRTRTDSFREDMFTIRDEMFDYMWKNQLSFDTPAYKLLRSSLNSAILIGDQLNIVIFYQTAKTMAELPENSELPKSIEMIEDPKHRDYFIKVMERIAERIMKFLFMEGFPGILLGVIFVVVGSLTFIEHLKRRWAVQPAQKYTYDLAALGYENCLDNRGASLGRRIA